MRTKICGATLAMLVTALLGWNAFSKAQPPSPPPPAAGPDLTPPNWATASPPPAKPAATEPLKLPPLPSTDPPKPTASLPSLPSLPPAPIPALPAPTLKPAPPPTLPAPTTPNLDVKPPAPTTPSFQVSPAPTPPSATPALPAPPAPTTGGPPPARPESVVTVPTAKPSGPTAPPAPPQLSGITASPRSAPPAPSAAGNAVEMPLEAGPGVSDMNPTGRQEPAVTLEWLGPPATKVGQPADYAILVRNTCPVAVQQVMVRAKLGPGLAVAATDPKASQEDSVLMWEVGTLFPKQEKVLHMRLVSPQKGDVACQAWVTFTGSSALRVRVREPKLTLKVAPPDRASFGDPCAFMLTVSNPGDYPAERVTMHAQLSAGLECAKGQKFDVDIGNLGAGETRAVQVICATRSGGAQSCSATVEAEGGLRAADKAAVHVHTPRLDLEVIGPRTRYLERRAVYTFRVTNPGDAAAANVTVADVVPAGFKFIAAENARHDYTSRTVTWFLGDIAPGQSREVKLELVAINAGEQQHKVIASAGKGLKVEGEVVTRVEGLSALLMEVVDTEDPVEVRSDTAYEIRVTNTGTKTETDVRVACTVPPQFRVKQVIAPDGVKAQIAGQEVTFEPLPKLAPRADAVYRITVTAVTKGDARFKATLTSTNLVEPVHKEESTRVYED